jgi:hypothetical protein
MLLAVSGSFKPYVYGIVLLGLRDSESDVLDWISLDCFSCIACLHLLWECISSSRIAKGIW